MANNETLLKITLKKSTSGRLKNHQATAESLGLRCASRRTPPLSAR